MKITDIKTLILHYPYKQWIADGCGSCGARGAFLILIETDTELQGIGEAATFGGSMDAMKNIVEKQLINPLSRYIFDNNVDEGKMVLIKKIEEDDEISKLICEVS